MIGFSLAQQVICSGAKILHLYVRRGTLPAHCVWCEASIFHKICRTHVDMLGMHLWRERLHIMKNIHLHVLDMWQWRECGNSRPHLIRCTQTTKWVAGILGLTPSSEEERPLVSTRTCATHVLQNVSWMTEGRNTMYVPTLESFTRGHEARSQSLMLRSGLGGLVWAVSMGR
jgi:hypothetical protein